MSFFISNSSDELSNWLEMHAQTWDIHHNASAEILTNLAKMQVTHIGVPSKFGGDGSSIANSIEAIAKLAYSSLTAAFVLWAHRAYIECVLQSPNHSLQEQQIPALLSGKVAGSAGLSNLMKTLAGLEKMEIFASNKGDDFLLNGKMPWVTNINASAYYTACAAENADGRPIALSLTNTDHGMEATQLELISLNGSDTASIILKDVIIDKKRILHDNIEQWLKSLRPAFIALQCGMSLGLAKRCLDEADKHFGHHRSIIRGELEDAKTKLQDLKNTLITSSNLNKFIEQPADIFKLRIALADCLSDAVMLELKARGGKAYLKQSCEGFPRRLREVSFMPIITPSVIQLQKALTQL